MKFARCIAILVVPAALLAETPVRANHNKDHLVWVDPGNKTYITHGKAFGHSSGGKFMTENDAKAAGYRLNKRIAPDSKLLTYRRDEEQRQAQADNPDHK